MENSKKILSLLGLATRSRNVVSGEFSTQKAVKEGSARLVIIAQDASLNTKKEFEDMCQFYSVPYFVFGSKEQLGHCMGKQFRASLAIIDDGFADSITKLIR